MGKKTWTIVGIALAVVIICVSVVLLVGNNDHSISSWQEGYDLGVRYLSEGNYKKAILAFSAAIEIEPKKPETYEKMAEAYIALGDIDSARAVLKQGVDATGEGSLRKLLEDLQKYGLVISSNNLSIRNICCKFVEDPNVIEWNEGAVGGMEMKFVVDGPSDVRMVLISTWYPFLPDHEQITEDIAELVELWKQSEFSDSNRVPPFDDNNMHPVYQEDFGKTFYVVLVGLDENCDAVGYVVVQEVVAK